MTRGGTTGFWDPWPNLGCPNKREYHKAPPRLLLEMRGAIFESIELPLCFVAALTDCARYLCIVSDDVYIQVYSILVRTAAKFVYYRRLWASSCPLQYSTLYGKDALALCAASQLHSASWLAWVNFGTVQPCPFPNHPSREPHNEADAGSLFPSHVGKRNNDPIQARICLTHPTGILPLPRGLLFGQEKLACLSEKER